MSGNQLQLSEVFLAIRAAGDRGIDVNMQYLETREDKFAVLSDGHFSGEFAVLKSVRPKLASLSPGEVVSTTVRIFKETFILLRIESLRMVAARIGQPLPIQPKSEVDYLAKPVQLVTVHTESKPSTRTDSADQTDGIIDDLWKDRKRIEQLSVADTNFTIFFRLEKKTLRNFRTALGSDRQLLSCIGFDETEKMSLTFFEPICRFADQILEEGALYCLSNGEVSKGSKWSPSRRGLSITYSRNAKDLYKVEDKLILSSIPEVYRRDIACVSFLQNLAHDDMVSILGVVVKKSLGLADETSSFSTVTLIDHKSQVEIRIWGNAAAHLEELEIGKIVICQNLKAFIDPKYPNSKQFKFTSNSRFITGSIPGDLDGMPRLKIIESGLLPDLNTLTRQSTYQTRIYKPSTIQQMIAETHLEASNQHAEVGIDSTSRYFEVNAYFSDLTRDKCFYRVCPRDVCKKGVSVNADGKVECEKCGSFNLGIKANSRYLGQATFSDFTGEFSAQFCDSKGDTILGMDANRAFELFEKDELTQAKLRRFGLHFTIGIIAVLHADPAKPPEFRLAYISEPTPEKILKEIKQLNREVRRLALSKQLLLRKSLDTPPPSRDTA